MCDSSEIYSFLNYKYLYYRDTDAVRMNDILNGCEASVDINIEFSHIVLIPTYNPFETTL